MRRTCPAALAVLFTVCNLALAQDQQAPRMIGGGPFHLANADLGIISFDHSQLTTAGNHYVENGNKTLFLAQFQVPSGKMIAEITLRTGSEPLEVAAGSSDGSRIALSYDGKLELRSTQNLGTVLLEIPQRFPATAIALTADGGKLLATYGASLITEFDTKTGEILRYFEPQGTTELHPLYGEKGQSLCFDETHVFRWTDEPKSFVKLFDAPQDVEFIQAIIRSETLYISTKSTKDKRGAIMKMLAGDFSNPRLLMHFDLQGNLIAKWPLDRSFAVSKEHLVMGHDRQLLRSGNEVDRLQQIGACNGLDQLQFTADAKLLAGHIAMDDGFQIWQTKDWKPHSANLLPYKNQRDAAIDDAGRVTVFSQDNLCVAQPGQELQVVHPLPKSITRYVSYRTLSGDGRLLAFISDDQRVLIYDLTRNDPFAEPLRTLAIPSELVPNGIQFSRTGKLLAVAYKPSGQTASSSFSSGLLQGFLGKSTPMTRREDLFQVSTGELIASHEIGDREVLMFPSFSGNDTVAYRTKTGAMWRRYSTPNRFRRITTGIWNVKLSESGSLVVADHNGKVAWYETLKSKPVIVMDDSDFDPRLNVNMSPDGKVVYVAVDDSDNSVQELRSISVPSGNLQWRSPLPEDPQQVHVSPNGNWILVSIGSFRWAVLRK